MKKAVLLSLVFTLTFALTGCFFDNDPECNDDQSLVDGVCVDDEVADTTAPVFAGVADITIFVDATFDVMTGVTATDDVDGDITDDVVITGTVDTSATGIYFLKYSSTDATGNKTEATRYVTVEVDPSLIGDEMVPNGDFSLGWAIWTSTTGNEGGMGNFTVVNEVLEVEITAVSGGRWEPRLENKGIEFENGITYEITFDAKALATRSIHIQIGEILDGAPWFDDFKAEGHLVIFDLTTEMQTFSFKFTMNDDTNANGSLIFEMGTVEGDVGVDNLLTTVFLDNVTIEESTPDADVTAPSLGGVDDLTIESGTVFDPLAGVTASDIVDGAITLEAADVAGTVDVNTPGEYTLTYTVADAAGNEVVEERVITVVDLVFNDTGAVVDGTFDVTTEITAEVQDAENNYADITPEDIWYNYLAGWDGAAATFAITEAAAVIDVTAPGNNDWGVMLKQKGLELQQGLTYKLSFDASAAVDRNISATVGDFKGTFDITATAATYELIFTFTDADITDGVAAILLGNTSSYAAGAVTIDNVVLSVLEAPVLVVNGNFEDLGWGTWSKEALFWAEDPDVLLINNTAEAVDGEYVVTYDGIGQQAWEMQLFQEGFALAAGSTYRITFDAYADVARSINAMMICEGEFRETIAITDVLGTYTSDFTVVTACANGKLDFEFAKVLGTETPGWVAFDNIKVEELVADAIVADTDMVVNGGFDARGWGTWSETNGVSTALVDGELVVTTGALGSANWAIQLFQEGIDLVEGATYTIAFDVRSDVARDINMKLIDGNGAEILEIVSVTTEMTTFTYTFVYEGTSDTGKLDFELGVIGDAVAGVVTFDNIIFYRTFNAQEATE